MDFIKNIQPRIAFIIYAAAAFTMAFFWLVLPTFSVWYGSFNGYQLMKLMFYTGYGFLAFLMLGNLVLPGIAFLMTFKSKKLDWLWASISFGYFFLTGIICACQDVVSLGLLWYMLFLLGSAWCAFSFLRRGLPASF